MIRFALSFAAVLLAFSSGPLLGQTSADEPGEAPAPLSIPDDGKIRVAFVLAPGATMIDFAGPWEVFQDVHSRSEGGHRFMPFELFVVAEALEPFAVSGGMQVTPDYTFETAPKAEVIVVPAMRSTAAMHSWLATSAATADLTMSVCTGAAVLAEAGLLDDRPATTHHHFLDVFQELYPKVRLERGVRWVDSGDIATAAGLTSGIDLALHVVARYFGEDVAAQTAEFMAHSSEDWRGGSRGGSAPESSMQVHAH